VGCAPSPENFCIYIKMVSFYEFPVIFIDAVTFKNGTLIKRAVVRTPWTVDTHPGSAPEKWWIIIMYSWLKAR